MCKDVAADLSGYGCTKQYSPVAADMNRVDSAEDWPVRYMLFGLALLFQASSSLTLKTECPSAIGGHRDVPQMYFLVYHNPKGHEKTCIRTSVEAAGKTMLTTMH